MHREFQGSSEGESAVKMRWLAIVAGMLLSLATGVAMATAQESEILLIEGKTYYLNTNPLSGFLLAHPDRKLAEGSHVTSNWRGYTGTWEIKGGRLWLRKVSVNFNRNDPERPDLKFDDPPDLSKCKAESKYYWQCDQTRDLFPGGGDILADWYSGTLIVPTGEITEYVHMGYGSTYSRYLVVWVRKGEVTRQLDLDEKQFMELRRERFEAFKKTRTYQDALAKSRKDLGKHAEDFIFQFYSEEYLSEDPETKPD
jgi:hypothetical protein